MSNPRSSSVVCSGLQSNQTCLHMLTRSNMTSRGQQHDHINVDDWCNEGFERKMARKKQSAHVGGCRVAFEFARFQIGRYSKRRQARASVADLIYLFHSFGSRRLVMTARKVDGLCEIVVSGDADLRRRQLPAPLQPPSSFFLQDHISGAGNQYPPARHRRVSVKSNACVRDGNRAASLLWLRNILELSKTLRKSSLKLAQDLGKCYITRHQVLKVTRFQKSHACINRHSLVARL